MMKMKEYLDTGKDFYSLQDALQDMYICLKMEETLENPNKEVCTETQIWADSVTEKPKAELLR